MTPPASTAAVPAHVRRLVLLGYVAVGGFAIWFWTASHWQDDELNLLGIGMLLLGAWPTLRWLGRHDDTYPLVETLLLTTVPFYALPVITEYEATADYPTLTLRIAGWVVLAFQLACIAGSELSAMTYTGKSRASWWRDALFPESRLRFTVHALTLMTVWLLVSDFTDWVPDEWIGTFRAIFFGIGILSTFIGARLWGNGYLSRNQKIYFCCNLVCQLVLIFVSLLLVQGIALALIGMVGYFSSARRIPWIPCIVLLPILGVLHNGKARMRAIYWQEGAAAVEFTDLPAFFTQWAEFGLQSSANGNEEHSKAITYGLMRRASLFQIVCITVNMIPERATYLEGDSYRLIPAQIFPRFLWPNKPSPNESMKLLAVHLGILTPEEAEHTSIGFGLLAEAYANFGFVSVAVLGFVLGFGLRRLAVSTVACATLSLPGVFRILCMAWCLSAETTLAVWLSSLYQACVAILIPMMLWKHFFGPGPGRGDS